MKYIFRGQIVFEYIPGGTHPQVIQHTVSGAIPAFNFCVFINEDYRLLSEFFKTVYRHTQGEKVKLKDIEVS